MIGQIYINHIISPIVQTYKQVCLMDDNTHPNRTTILREDEIKEMEWPLLSLDIININTLLQIQDLCK